MPCSEIVNFIKAFKPARRLIEPSAEDLASELAVSVSTAPLKLSAELVRFYGLAPEYIAAIVHGFKSAAEAERPIDWDPVFDLCMHILNQPWVQNKDVWRRARREVVDLLRDGLMPTATEIPFENRDKAWTVVENLLEDPDLIPEDEAQRSRQGIYSLSINSTRGRAMETAVFYGVWVYRHSKPIGTAPFAFSLEDAPKLC